MAEGTKYLKSTSCIKKVLLMIMLNDQHDYRLVGFCNSKTYFVIIENCFRWIVLDGWLMPIALSR